MIPLLFVVFFIELVCYLVLTIGSKPVNDLLWQLYCSTGLGPAKDFSEQRRLKQEVVNRKRELAGISAQDNFSKWAKLRRQHDKALEEYDRKAAATSSARSSFDTKATVVRWTCTRGLQFAIQFWHTKTPVFTYPRAWFPWQIEWVLGFPRCPYGGVSINVWSNSCSIVLALTGELIIYGLRYVQEIRSRQPTKIAMEAKSK